VNKPERAGRILGAGGSGMLALVIVLTALAPQALARSPASYLAGDRSLVKSYALLEGAKLGVSLPGGPLAFISVTESSKRFLEPEKRAADGTRVLDDAETLCVDAAGEQIGPAAHCQITLATSAHGGELRATIAHEVFHVFQAVLSETMKNETRPDNEWLMEGSATWVETDLVHTVPAGRDWWTIYLRSPHVPLFKRGYDAIGFFGHLAASGISPWGRFRAIFRQTGNEGAYAAAEVNKTFLDTEASAFFREPALGAAWDEHGPDLPTREEVGYRPTSEDISTTEELLDVAPHADSAYRLSLKKMPASEPVLEVRVSGADVRLRSTAGGDVNEVDTGGLDLCSDAHGCNCPGQAAVKLARFKLGDLALGGGTGGGRVWLIPRKRCETLLAAHTCEGLLPEFVVPSEAPAGQSKAIETVGPTPGYDSYTCLFPGEKGHTIQNAAGEPEFDGVMALVVTVTRYPSVVVAERSFLPPADSAANLILYRPAIGEQAIIETSGEAAGNGEDAYTSLASVRVRNVIATFSILSGGGSNEADATGAAALLTQVAEEL
jgi:hypothetical protein